MKYLKPAEFRVQLPGGGAFYAAWPQTVTDIDLRMVRAMLDVNLEMWIDHAKGVAAGEVEYASWFPVAREFVPVDDLLRW
jgi:hypothetical protein